VSSQLRAAVRAGCSTGEIGFSIYPSRVWIGGVAWSIDYHIWTQMVSTRRKRVFLPECHTACRWPSEE